MYDEKIDKWGEVKKCPVCRAVVGGFVIRCAECGTEFRNTEVTQSIHVFMERLNKLELHRNVADSQINKPITFGRVLLWLFFWPYLLIWKFFCLFRGIVKDVELSPFDIQRREFILNYPIPTSKEDMFEFVALFYSKIEDMSYFDFLTKKGKKTYMWNKIWMQKIEYLNQKAIFSMHADRKSYAQLEIVVNNGKKRQKENTKKLFHVFAAYFLIVILLIGGIIYVFVEDQNRIDERRALISEVENRTSTDEMLSKFSGIKMETVEDHEN